MSRAATVTLDTSVWIPYLRERRYARTIEPLVASARLWIPGVVLLELYAGAPLATDRRAIAAIHSSARSLARLYSPSEDDLCLAGQILAYYGRTYGRVRPRNHSHDLLIAIGAARTSSLLLSDNIDDMARWAKALGRRGKLRVRVERPAD